MATYTLRPNANWNGAASFTISGGSASAHAALADSSDSTFITRTSTTIPASYETEFDTQTLTSSETVTSVNLRARISVGTAGLAQFSLGVITDRNGRTVTYGVPVTKQNTLALTTVDLSLNLPNAPTGAAWTQTLIDNLVVKITDGATTSGDRSNIYALFIDVVTAAKPTVTVNAPTGTITDTSFPAVTWTYANTDGNEQSAYEIKIFDSTTYSGGSFSADTSTPTLGTGIIVSNNDGQTLEGDLANSTTYRAYVRVATLINGNNYFSDFAFSQFSLSIDSPASPTISAFYDSTSGAVNVTVFGRTNALSENQASLETDTTGWVSLSNCSLTRNTVQYLSGIASLALTATAAGDMTATTTSATAFTVTPATKFSATAQFKANTTARSTSIGILWRNSSGTTLSTVFGTAENDSSSAWNECTVSGTAPATAATAMVVIKVASAGSGEVHYIDKIAFHAGESPTWTRGGFSTFTFVVERSNDGGTTYTELRDSPVSASTSQIATLEDYEVPFDLTVLYRAKARAEI
jgi:hypothetical protein